MTINDDRRSGVERRKSDFGYLVQYDRRLSDNRRKPELEVEELSGKYWEIYFNNFSGVNKQTRVG